MATRIGDSGPSTAVAANSKLNSSAKASGTGAALGVTPAKVSVSGQSADGLPVELSNGARSKAAEMQKAKQIAQDTPDIREDKVAAIKERIKNGTYQLDSGLIADGILREAIRDHLTLRDDR